MRVQLTDGDSTESVDFNADAHHWKQQGAGSRFLVALKTSLKPPFDCLFVKRWVNQCAPGHALLEQIVGAKLPNTPRLFGFAKSGGDFFYFFENLSTYALLEDILFKQFRNKPSMLSSTLIGRNVGLVVASSFYDLFKRVSELGFIYPDFTQRNIMIDFSNKTLPCMMIDLDSCFPKGKLADNINTAGRFSVFYWGAWRKEMPRHTVDLLLISMILSFTAVWARAIALLRTSPTPDDALKLIRNPNYQSAQASFWTALKDRNRTDIQRHFLLADQKAADLAFTEWKGAADAIWSSTPPRRETIGKDKLLQIVATTFAQVRMSHVAVESPEPPLKPLTDQRAPAATPPITTSFGISWPVFGNTLRFLFAFKGRLSRGVYIGRLLGASIASGFIYMLAVMINDMGYLSGETIRYVLLSPSLLLILFFLWSSNVRRAHDFSVDRRIIDAATCCVSGLLVATIYGLHLDGALFDDDVAQDVFAVMLVWTLASFLIAPIAALIPGAEGDNKYS